MTDKNRSDMLAMVVLVAAGIVWFIIRMQRGEFFPPSAGDVFTYIIFAPLAEELFFRGVLQDHVNDWLRKNGRKHLFIKTPVLSKGNIFTSLVFLLVHIPFWGVSHSLLVFFPSIAFGFIYDKTGKLVYPIFLHAVYNVNVFIV
ncbi:MAG: hypothetical protein C0602_09840 [Denitrovibrio sp.]|nr:MAG: hypothetical protein C0602_09840 [Denitrovibrio sp.]